MLSPPTGAQIDSIRHPAEVEALASQLNGGEDNDGNESGTWRSGVRGAFQGTGALMSIFLNPRPFLPLFLRFATAFLLIEVGAEASIRYARLRERGRIGETAMTEEVRHSVRLLCLVWKGVGCSNGVLVAFFFYLFLL